MYTKPVSIYDTGMTADGGKVETAFGFFDEIFHLSATIIKQDYVVWLCFHRCDNEKFSPNAEISRAQAITFIARAYRSTADKVFSNPTKY